MLCYYYYAMSFIVIFLHLIIQIKIIQLYILIDIKIKHKCTLKES